MNLFKNLSIRGKFLMIVLLFFGLELIIAVVGIVFLISMNRTLKSIANVDTRRVELTSNIGRNLLAIQSAKRGMVMVNKQEELDQFSADITALDKEIVQMVSELDAKSAETGKALVRQFMSDYAAFVGVADELEERLSGDLSQPPTVEGEAARSAPTHFDAVAIRLLHEKGNEAYQKAAASLKEVEDRNQDRLASAKVMAAKNVELAVTLMGGLSFVSIILSLGIGLIISRSVSTSLGRIITVADNISAGNLETPVEITGNDEVGRVATAMSRMQTSLREVSSEVAGRDWLKTGIVRLNEAMHGDLDIPSLSARIIEEVATCLGAKVGALYFTTNSESEPILKLMGGYACTARENLPDQFKFGEGLVGQAALAKKQIIFDDVPENYIKIASSLGEASPKSILVAPFLFENSVSGVLEIGLLNPITDLQLEYLNRATSAIAPNMEAARNRRALRDALSESQSLAKKLQAQQEELKAANEELEEQTRLLKQSEEQLKTQQEELQAAYDELEQKNEFLNSQKVSIEEANKELERTRREIQAKAEELASASKYKSEFLANMSHELRTPLNSLLLLSKLLTENREGNLTQEQVDSAETIYSSGNDLLSLLNEILDLSKVEAGRMEVHVESVSVHDIAESMRSKFQPIADEKGISLDIFISNDIPAEILTDQKRIGQILKNLVSNAIKFTEEGGITITFSRPDKETDLSASGLRPETSIAIAVKDTGIGIPADKQRVIFEAFQQAEGGTSRKFGGTGLGLSISTKIADLLGGEIQLKSEEGKGSTFAVFLPIKLQKAQKVAAASPAKPCQTSKVVPTETRIPNLRNIPDDRDELKEGDKVILVIEDDPKFAALLIKRCHAKGFRCIVCPTGEEGLQITEKHLPHAVILDIRLPGIDGWAVLDALKESPRTRHIPVHIMSIEEATIETFRKGAIGHLTKPAQEGDLEEAFHKLETMFERKVKDLLVVEDDEILRKSIIKLIGNSDVNTEEARTGEKTIEILRQKNFDCMILDLGLPDMSGFDLLKKLEEEEKIAIPPIIVYTGKELTREEETELRRYSESIIIKGVRSEERLLDEVSLFLHRVVENLPEKTRNIIAHLHDKDTIFRDKRVLIVDDDMRNVFAIAKVLEQKGMKAIKADNGQKALSLLCEEPNVDLILMDIMMPVMDGYETMKRIREQEHFQKTPIIALTAKAMKGDRDHCIEAGASDYLSKPVDLNRLFSLMRIWMYQ